METFKFCLQSVKSWDSRTDLTPSLYVLECIELELALKVPSREGEEPLESDFSCPIKLHRGRSINLSLLCNCVLKMALYFRSSVLGCCFSVHSDFVILFRVIFIFYKKLPWCGTVGG